MQTQLSPSRLPDLNRSVARSYLLPLLGFVLITAAVFAPLVARLSSGVLRGPTDGARAIRQLWLLERLGKSPFTADRDPLLGAPEGIPLSPAIDFAQPLQPAVGWLGSQAVGEAAAFNLFLLAGFVVTAFATYVLLYRLRLHPAAAFFGGLIVAFNPWMVERALEGHAAFVHTWTLMLVIGAITIVHATRSLRWAAVAGAALALCFLTAAYIGLLAMLIAVVLLIVMTVRTSGVVERLWITSLASIAALTTLVLLAPAAIAYVRNRESVDAVASHASEELSSYSATAASYLRPSAQHPVLGSLGVDPVLGSGESERVLYFGFATLALAVVAIAMLLFVRRSPFAGRELRFVLVGMAVLAPVAFVFSMPPRVDVGGVSIPLPSALLGEVTSFYRVYARFGFVFGIAIALLAAAAVSALLRGSRRQVVLAVAAMALVAFELFPGRVSVWSTTPRPHDRWLSQQPDGIVANYPLPTDKPETLALALEEQYLQRYHGRPLFTLVSGGTGGTREQAIRVATRYLHEAVTPGLLAAEGVRYVLVHDDVFREMGETPPAAPPGFRLAARFGDVRALELGPDVAPSDVDVVLEEQAAAIAAVLGLPAPTIEVGSGFSAPVGEADESGWRELDETGSIELVVDDARLRRVLLLLQARSIGGERTLQILDESGNVIAESAVGETVTSLTLGPIGVRAPRTRLTLRVAPSAESEHGILVGPPSAQPLADYSVSLRERR